MEWSLSSLQSDAAEKKRAEKKKAEEEAKMKEEEEKVRILCSRSCYSLTTFCQVARAEAKKAKAAAANAAKKILAEAGFPDIEVAFVESVVTRSVATGPKLLRSTPR